MSGLLLLDKPAGMLSNAALQRVKRLYDARKAGHTGALDRPATGCLPICLGEATKLTQFLLDADKRYVTTLALGTRTSTGDAEGDVVARAPVPPLTAGALEAVLARFRGDIEQVPPMFSALKRDGTRLHRLAYQGKEIERAARPVRIISLDCRRFAPPAIELEVVCSKGTYIRVLGEDIGAALGCGAHLSGLRRLGVGPFDAAGMVTLEHLEALADAGAQALDALLHPVDAVVSPLPEVRLSGDLATRLRQGQCLSQVACDAPAPGPVRLYDGDGAFFGVGELKPDRSLTPRRLLATQELVP